MCTTSLRAGLIHIALGTPGSALPSELASIKFVMAFCEIGEADSWVHAIVNKLFAAGKASF